MCSTRQDKVLSPRIQRELETVEAMIVIYCRGNHGAGEELCPGCRELRDYTRRRVERCPFRRDKPTCLNCSVHCFKPERREQIRTVMRYAGPRMPWRHPVLSLFHVIDGRRATPARPGSRRKGRR